MMKEKLIKKFPLTKKVDCEFECYEAQKRRYVIFLDKKVCKENVTGDGSLLHNWEL